MTIILSDDEYRALSDRVQEINLAQMEEGINQDDEPLLTMTELVRQAIDAMLGTEHTEIIEGSTVWRSPPMGRRRYTP